MVKEDRDFFESMLHSMAFKIYTQMDLAPTKEEGEAAVYEYEQFIYETAREIFEQYRKATTNERLILGMSAAIHAKDYIDGLENDPINKLETNKEDLLQEFFDKIGLE